MASLAQYRTEQRGDQAAYTFLHGAKAPAVTLTYGQLFEAASQVAAQLVELGLENQPVLLVYPTGLDFIVAFWACMLSGNIAVPVPPPRGPHRLDWLSSLVVDSTASVILTNSPLYASLSEAIASSAALKRVQLVATDSMPSGFNPKGLAPTEARPDSLAVLQYTSGSTGRPKGVMITHSNILHNEELICRAFHHGDDTVVVSCLPHFHDMGLFGNFLQPFYLGTRCVFMSPDSFVRKPMRWLKAISDFGGTTSGGPNFAFDLCVERLSTTSDDALDLSRWSLAFIGAEPIRAGTLRRFAEAFGPYGFRASSFYPCYGLAEATLFVSGGSLGESFAPGKSADADIAAEPVSCGKIIGDQPAIIVDPSTWLPCEDGQQGEIWLRGPSVAKGYWRNPELSQGSFSAVTFGGDGPYLRTGDLGYIKNETLYVSGRLKALVIVNGNNYHAEDIEAIPAHAHRSLAEGGCAAFGILGDNGEELIVVAEIRRAAVNEFEPNLVGDLVNRKIAEIRGISPRTVIFLRPAGIPRTTSGKIRRDACRQLFLAGKLPEVGRWYRNQGGAETSLGGGEAEMQVRAWLASAIAERLQVPVEQINAADPFPVLGLDSKDLFELSDKLSEWQQSEFDPVMFWECPTIEQLAAYLAASSDAG